MQVFEEWGKPKIPRENLSEQRREPTNATHIWNRVGKSDHSKILNDLSHLQE